MGFTNCSKNQGKDNSHSYLSAGAKAIKLNVNCCFCSVTIHADMHFTAFDIESNTVFFCKYALGIQISYNGKNLDVPKYNSDLMGGCRNSSRGSEATLMSLKNILERLSSHPRKHISILQCVDIS